MRVWPTLSIALCASFVLLACGDETETEPEQKDNATVNKPVAQAAASSAFGAVEMAIMNGDGQAAAFQLASVGSTSVGILTPTGGGQPQGHGQAKQGLGEGTCDCTANACSFTDCGDPAGFTITGTISWTANSLDCNYTVGGTVAGNVYNFGMFCDLDYTATSLAGVLDSSGDYQVTAGGQSVSSSWDVGMTFNAVTYPGPSGGSMDVAAETTVNGQTYAATSTVTFP